MSMSRRVKLTFKSYPNVKQFEYILFFLEMISTVSHNVICDNVICQLLSNVNCFINEYFLINCETLFFCSLVHTMECLVNDGLENSNSEEASR